MCYFRLFFIDHTIHVHLESPLLVPFFNKKALFWSMSFHRLAYIMCSFSMSDYSLLLAPFLLIFSIPHLYFVSVSFSIFNYLPLQWNNLVNYPPTVTLLCHYTLGRNLISSVEPWTLFVRGDRWENRLNHASQLPSIRHQINTLPRYRRAFPQRNVFV